MGQLPNFNIENEDFSQSAQSDKTFGHVAKRPLPIPKVCLLQIKSISLQNCAVYSLATSVVFLCGLMIGVVRTAPLSKKLSSENENGKNIG